MADCVLDASALLALLQNERGAEYVRRRVPGAVMSAVNLAETGSKLADLGFSAAEIREAMIEIGIEVSPFDIDQAIASSVLRAATRPAGLSVGDRACLALAQLLGLPALTADRAWRDLGLDVGVELIRE